MPVADDPIAGAAAQLDHDAYVLEPDGTTLPQSTQPGRILDMLRMLEPGAGMRVLEIGTGSGYTGALLSRIVGDQGMVVSLDVDAALTERAQHRHARLGVDNLAVRTADGFAGWAADGPYDRIIAWPRRTCSPEPGSTRRPTSPWSSHRSRWHRSPSRT